MSRNPQVRRGAGPTDVTESTGVLQPPPVERRGAPRLIGPDVSTFTAQVLDGPAIEVLNISRTGVLTRSEARLMPGAMIGLRFVMRDDSVVLFGRVVRSRLLSIAEGKPYYESALAFSREFPLLPAGSQPARVAELEAAHEQRPAQHGSFPAEIGRMGGTPTVLTVTAFANDRSEDVLRAMDVRE